MTIKSQFFTYQEPETLKSMHKEWMVVLLGDSFYNWIFLTKLHTIFSIFYILLILNESLCCSITTKTIGLEYDHISIYSLRPWRVCTILFFVRLQRVWTFNLETLLSLTMWDPKQYLKNFFHLSLSLYQ